MLKPYGVRDVEVLRRIFDIAKKNNLKFDVQSKHNGQLWVMITDKQYSDFILKDTFKLLISKETASKYYSEFDINFQVPVREENVYTMLDKIVLEAIKARDEYNIKRYNHVIMLMKCILDEYGNECDLGTTFLHLLYNKCDFGLLSQIIFHSDQITQRIVKEKLYIKKVSHDPEVNNLSNPIAAQKLELSMLGRIVYSGRVTIFVKIMSVLVQICNVKSWKELVSYEILAEKSLQEWIALCNERKHRVFGSFLMSVYENAWKRESWDVFCVLFNIVRTTGNAGPEQENEEAEELSVQFNKDFKCAQYLFNNCKKETVNDLANVINNGLTKQECGFNDSLLILSKMVDSNKFINTLANVTDECLTHNKKTIGKHCFFKNNLLHSNIWTMEKQEKKEKEQEKDVITDVDEKTTNDNASTENLQRQIAQSGLLFDEIGSTVVSNELKYQRMFIQNSIINEEKNNSDSWNKLKEFHASETIGTDDSNVSGLSTLLQSNKGLELLHQTYGINELPFDNVNGFDGCKEYDRNGYLTELLILGTIVCLLTFVFLFFFDYYYYDTVSFCLSFFS